MSTPNLTVVPCDFRGHHATITRDIDELAERVEKLEDRERNRDSAVARELASVRAELEGIKGRIAGYLVAASVASTSVGTILAFVAQRVFR